MDRIKSHRLFEGKDLHADHFGQNGIRQKDPAQDDKKVCLFILYNKLSIFQFDKTYSFTSTKLPSMAR